MRFLLLLVALVAGAFVGWMSVLAGIWFIMPVFLVCAVVVSIAFDKATRWRVIAFSIGLFAAFAIEASEFVTGVNEQIVIQEKQAEKLKNKQKEEADHSNSNSAIPALPSAN